MIAIVHVTEESGLKTGIQQRKQKREVADAVRNINEVQVALQQSSETSEEQEDLLPDIGSPRKILSPNQY